MAIFSIQRAGLGNPRCHLTRAKLAPAAYAVYLDGRQLSPDAAKDNAPAELVELMGKLTAAVGDPCVDDSTIGVASSGDTAHNSLCPIAGRFGAKYEPVSRRGPWELATGLRPGEQPTAISERCADRLAPRLSSALRAILYPNAPVPDRLESRDEIAVREQEATAKREKERTATQRKVEEQAARDALRRIACALVGENNPSQGAIERAEQLADGLQSYLERRKHLP
jgi:hypothetical protein